MRTERMMKFAEVQGTLVRYGISSHSPARKTVAALEDNVKGMTSEQIALIKTLLEQVVVERDRVVKERIKKAIDDLPL